MEKPFSSLKKLKETINKKLGKKQLAITAGFFDLIHPGHIRYLEKCKSKGDILIVAIDCDERARIQKGNNRPIQKQAERAEVINALKCVDYVYLHGEVDSDPIIKLAENFPGAICMQSLTSFQGKEKEETLRQICKELILLPSSYQSSSSQLIENILSKG